MSNYTSKEDKKVNDFIVNYKSEERNAFKYISLHVFIRDVWTFSNNKNMNPKRIMNAFKDFVEEDNVFFKEVNAFDKILGKDYEKNMEKSLYDLKRGVENEDFSQKKKAIVAFLENASYFNIKDDKMTETFAVLSLMSGIGLDLTKIRDRDFKKIDDAEYKNKLNAIADITMIETPDRSVGAIHVKNYQKGIEKVGETLKVIKDEPQRSPELTNALRTKKKKWF